MKLRSAGSAHGSRQGWAAVALNISLSIEAAGPSSVGTTGRAGRIVCPSSSGPSPQEDRDGAIHLPAREGRRDAGRSARTSYGSTNVEGWRHDSARRRNGAPYY